MRISIHALLAESDATKSDQGANTRQFLSTLSLRRATQTAYFFLAGETFLSTLSLRRATCGGHISKARSKHFYPRSPCGERPAFDFLAVSAVQISIHALLAESDPYVYILVNTFLISIHALLAESDATKSEQGANTRQFLSTLSLRRATNERPGTRQPCAISIHALLAESDPGLPGG